MRHMQHCSLMGEWSERVDMVARYRAPHAEDAPRSTLNTVCKHTSHGHQVHTARRASRWPTEATPHILPPCHDVLRKPCSRRDMRGGDYQHITSILRSYHPECSVLPCLCNTGGECVVFALVSEKRRLSSALSRHLMNYSGECKIYEA